MGAGVRLWSPICVLRQLKLVGEWGGGRVEIPAAWGLEEAGRGGGREPGLLGGGGRVEAKGLSLASPKGMGTVSGEQEQTPPSIPSPHPHPHPRCHVCFVRSRSLD